MMKRAFALIVVGLIIAGVAHFLFMDVQGTGAGAVAVSERGSMEEAMFWLRFVGIGLSIAGVLTLMSD